MTTEKPETNNTCSIGSPAVAGGLIVATICGGIMTYSNYSDKKITQIKYDEVKQEIVETTRITPDSTYVNGQWVRKDKVETLYTLKKSDFEKLAP